MSARLCPARLRHPPCTPMHRGTVLLEVVAALALFVIAGLAILSLLSQAVRSLERMRDAERAADIARSAITHIELGLYQPEALDGRTPPWLEPDALDLAGSIPDADLAPTSRRPDWTLTVETEPTAFAGLTLVTVHVQRGDDGPTAFTLRQLVRLGLRPDASIGPEDELVEQARRGRTVPPAGPPSSTAPGGQP